MKYYIVNEYLKGADKKCLVHDASSKTGYQTLEKAEDRARQINNALVDRGLVRQAAVVSADYF